MFSYPERLYFFLDTSHIKTYIQRFKITKKKEKFDVYQISTKYFDNIRLLIDPNLPGAVYTMELVPSHAIELIQLVNLI